MQEHTGDKKMTINVNYTYIRKPDEKFTHWIVECKFYDEYRTKV